MLKIAIQKLSHGIDLPLPHHATPFSAGVDLLAAIETSMALKPQTRILVPTGISIALPPGYEAQIRPRSGLALNHGITVLNSPGTIDADYRGEIKVILQHFGDTPFLIERGMRIAQMIISTYSPIDWVEVSEHSETSLREQNGFGSTGLKASL